MTVGGRAKALAKRWRGPLPTARRQPKRWRATRARLSQPGTRRAGSWGDLELDVGDQRVATRRGAGKGDGIRAGRYARVGHEMTRLEHADLQRRRRFSGQAHRDLGVRD